MAFNERIGQYVRRFRRMFSRNFARTVAEVSKEMNVSSSEMMDAIDLWLSMYEDKAPWLANNEKTLGIPAIIASEIALLVTLEMEMNITGPEGEQEGQEGKLIEETAEKLSMNEFLSREMKNVLKGIRENTEYACAGGGIVFKPYIFNDGINVEVIHANDFVPFSYDNSRKITGAFFVYRKWIGKKIYSRLEKHELKGTDYIISNQAYESTVEDSLGKPCSMSSVDEWADIEEEVRITGIETPLFSYFRIPIGNVVDKDSPLGVSVFAKAVSLIKDADEQYSRVSWEYEGGELAIDASVDAFRMVGGEPRLPEGKERLYRTNELDSEKAGSSLMKEWAPNLRDSNYWSGLNRILMKIEDACSVSRGLLSESTSVALTATEIRQMKQRSYALVSKIQESLEGALGDLVKSMEALAILYELAEHGEYSISYKWDDSIVIDAESERIRDQQEVNQGLMKKYEYRMKWYGEDETTAKRMVEDNSLTDEEILGLEPPVE